MKLVKIVALVAVFFTGFAMAGLEQLAAVLPPCGLKCLVGGIEKSTCAMTDQACICTNPALNANVNMCVELSCTIKESLTTKNVTATACHAPVRDRTHVVGSLGVAGLVVVVVAFVLRIIARFRCCGGQFGWDDGTMVITMMLVLPISALSQELAHSGLGKDVWTLPFENITRILMIYLVDECLYLSILPLTKISILFFYLRVFPKKEFRIATYIVIGFNVAYGITFVLISLFQCSPVKGAYLRWDGEHHYKCNDINAQGWAAAVFNMVLDITVMFMPLPELYKLNLSIRKKIGLLCMFSLGIFVTLVSILRLNSLIKFATTTNITWDYTEIGYWSVIECQVGVICACLPAIRSLLRRVFPTAFGDTNKDNNSKGSMSRSAGTGSRLEGKIVNKVKGGDESHFVPLVNMDNSSQAHLAHV